MLLVDMEILEKLQIINEKIIKVEPILASLRSDRQLSLITKNELSDRITALEKEILALRQCNKEAYDKISKLIDKLSL